MREKNCIDSKLYYKECKKTFNNSMNKNIDDTIMQNIFFLEEYKKVKEEEITKLVYI